MESVRKIITTGYSIIIIIVVGIAYIWYCEWQEVEVLEVGNQQINEFRKEVNRIHIRLIEYCSGTKRIWKIIMSNASHWTAYYAVSMQLIQLRELTACVAFWKTRNGRCTGLCRCLRSNKPSTIR